MKKKCDCSFEYCKGDKRMKNNIEKAIVYGVCLGWMASMLYLMLILTATLTA